MIRRLICDIVLIADSKPTFVDKFYYLLNIMCALAPIAYLLNGFNVWFDSNRQFSTFFILCFVANMIVGIAYHIQMKTFSWEMFLKRNSIMITVIIVVYALLEMLRITIGENIGGDAAKILIQVTTLLYPISKALKNIYILTNGQYPPKFIMEKLYNFEKTGDFKELLDTTKKE